MRHGTSGFAALKIRGQFQDMRDVVKLPLPVVDFSLQAIAAEPITLPDGEIDELDIQIRQR